MKHDAQMEIARRSTQAQFPFLIEITHETMGPFYYANSDETIAYDGKNYLSAVFSLQPPDRDGSKIGDAQLTISAVDQQWTLKIRSTQKPAKLRFIAAIVYQKDGSVVVERLEENAFTLRAASWNEIAITWNMTFDENMTILLPAEDCTALTCPGVS
ncbi:MAG: hypothetical protein LBK63_12715 [Treponema sp.]|nr:hypothetical protein [Treponema sp.]